MYVTKRGEAKLDEGNHYECVYMVDAEKWKHFLKVHDFFAAYADQHYGSISEVSTPPATVDAFFSVEVDSVDFYNEILRQFTDIITHIDTLSFKNSGDDSVLVTVCVRYMWKAVESNE